MSAAFSKGVKILRSVFNRPKAHTISSPSSEDNYSTGTSTSEGQASPELDMRHKTEGE